MNLLSKLIKCMECGRRMEYVNHSHLSTHGLTTEEYKKKYPFAEFASPKLKGKLSELHKEMAKEDPSGILNSYRVFHRKCRRCGKEFESGSARSHYCEECQFLRRRERHRRARLRHEKRRRNTVGAKRGAKRAKNNGTFSNRYLEEIKRRGQSRIHGAVMLEKGRTPNGSHPWDGGSLQCDWCGGRHLLMIMDHISYCIECTHPLKVARENQHYTIPAELCCIECGLVIT